MALLGEINDENCDRDLVTAGAVREVGIHEDSVSVDIRLGYHLADKGEEQQVEGKMSKAKLIEAVVGKKEKKVIKTVKVKDIK